MYHKDTQKMVFLLGGHDLEMNTIKEILMANGFPYYDKSLTWNDARLSAYSEELEKHPDSCIYGIELQPDMAVPSNYHSIDHHGDNTGMYSSLEILAELIGYNLSDKEKLIAANDQGYIPAMEQLGASKKQIREIRKLDRRAQGITKKDEELAQIAMQEADTSYPGIVFAKSTTGKFAALEDLLFDHYRYHSHVIYSDDELCVYGDISKAFTVNYKDASIYYGGTLRKFAGFPAGTVNSESIGRILKVIKSVLYNNI